MRCLHLGRALAPACTQPPSFDGLACFRLPSQDGLANTGCEGRRPGKGATRPLLHWTIRGQLALCHEHCPSRFLTSRVRTPESLIYDSWLGPVPQSASAPHGAPGQALLMALPAKRSSRRSWPRATHSACCHLALLLALQRPTWRFPCCHPLMAHPALLIAQPALLMSHRLHHGAPHGVSSAPHGDYPALLTALG